MQVQRIHLVVETENAAFEEGWEGAVEDVLEQARVWLARVPSEIVSLPEDALAMELGGVLRDVNGNVIGELVVYAE